MLQRLGEHCRIGFYAAIAVAFLQETGDPFTMNTGMSNKRLSAVQLRDSVPSDVLTFVFNYVRIESKATTTDCVLMKPGFYKRVWASLDKEGLHPPTEALLWSQIAVVLTFLLGFVHREKYAAMPPTAIAGPSFVSVVTLSREVFLSDPSAPKRVLCHRCTRGTSS